MFTGIIEQLGVVKDIKKEGENIHFTIQSAFSDELKIDQSVAHNGCCLTVVHIDGDLYTVTAIQETLNKTNLGDWTVGSKVNLERCIYVLCYSRKLYEDINITQSIIDRKYLRSR